MGTMEPERDRILLFFACVGLLVTAATGTWMVVWLLS